MRFYFCQHIVFILILLVLQGKSFSHARRVKKVTVTVVTTQKELAMEGDINFSLQNSQKKNSSLQKENVRNGAKVETSAIIGGREMRVKTKKKAKNSKKVSMAVESADSVGKRKEDERKKWKDNFMAFSADYRTPKPHPPKNN